jgi:pimeloyl-ACP methyl ester carboxylesterase
MHIYYLHGFASSPRSKKAVYFAERLRPLGLRLRCPDFNEPDFSSLTMTRMLDRLAADVATLDSQPIALIGSSLGAVVAIHAAARLGGRIDRLVLLAPAVMFPRDAPKVLGAERVAGWQATGTLDVFHHADGGMRPLSYGFYEDSVQYDAFAADVRQPTLILQGVRDASVDYRVVEQFAAARLNMQLTLLDDEHQLMVSLPRIWHDTAAFLELEPM